MKILLFLCCFALIFGGCKTKTIIAPDTQGNIENPDFFPVTTFIKGQIADIRSLHVNPIKFTTIEHKHDSLWLRDEDLDRELQPFLFPVIDTLNLVNLFTQTKFLDQSVNAYTFTYDPIKQLPDTFNLLHWDVYVNPEEGTIRRVYMVKKIDSLTQQQLTWQSGEWCKILTVGTLVNGNKFIKKEETVKWKF